MADPRTSRRSSRARLDELVNRLREQILTGEWAAGQYLPSEKWLAAEHQLSNQSVRKGLAKLAEEGLIRKIPRVGTRVVGPAEGVTATIRLGYHASVTGEADILQLIAKFHKQHPQFRVQAVPLAISSYNNLGSYLQNEILDVVMLNYNQFLTFMDAGGASSLESMDSNGELYTFLSEAFAYEGRQLALPFIFSPLILCYNRRHFQEQGLPEPDSGWSWTDLTEVASRLSKQKERIGFHCDFYSINRWPLLPLQLGAKAERYADGRIRLTGTKLMEALHRCKAMKEMFPLIADGTTTGQSERMLREGKVSMIMTTYFYLNYLRGASLPFDVAPVPHFGQPATMLLNIGLAVSRQSRVKESALQLVRFLTSSAAQQYIRLNTYSLPARKLDAEWSGEEVIYRPSRFSLFREIIPSFHYISDLGLSAAELERLHESAKWYWAGLESEEGLALKMESPEEG
ncbi:extracellular solute-binding protein [Paenibacillus senegalensis]|uniref:extracellular solute-binding protein n=1 Tax=Paenibacillus senegalensis TaxID=1465766 RepID=UPI000289B0DA|nr:extracellular solute-binding protein [Paenibacillus senegalensis]